MNLRKLGQFALLLALILPIGQGLAQRQISLKAPKFEDSDILGANAGIRPYRKGGMRLEKEEVGTKSIYHNYGHGGAGASLAYGSAKHSVEQFLQERNPEEPIAVLGSGYMGLMTANMLADLGYKVTVYADMLPVEHLQIHTLCMTSLIAGGLWLPFGIDVQNRTLFGQIVRNSFAYYEIAIQEGTYEGLKFANVYQIANKPDNSELPEGTLKEWEEVALEFGNGKYFKAWMTQTILLDGYVFLNELFNEAKSKGVVFEKRRFADLEEVLALEENVVFNNLGLGSKTLFNDENLVGIRGHHIYLKPQPEVDYFLFASKASGRPISLYPSKLKIASGFSYEEGEEDVSVSVEKIEESKSDLREFFRDKVLSKTKEEL